MGQLYIALEPERNEYILPTVFGSGGKRSAILNSGVSTLDALAVLLADPGRRRHRPADVHIASRTGRWAGRRVILQGEHGQSGDTANWPGRIPEGDAYENARSCGFEMGGCMVGEIHRVHGMAAGRIRTRCDGRTVQTPVTIGLRRSGDRLVVDEDGSPGDHLVVVREQVARRISKADPDSYVIDAWDGARRVIANLDSHEYIDPAQLAEIPTLAGMLRGNLKRWTRSDPESTQNLAVPTAIGLLGRMLFKRDPMEDERLGRWRGDRIIITHEESPSWPTTSGIQADPAWRDVTPMLIDEGIDWMEFHRRTESQRYGDIAPEAS